MITENLSTLKIHKLTQEQYDRELAAGNIDASALYLTPEEEVATPQYTASSKEEFDAIMTEVFSNIDIGEYRFVNILLNSKTSYSHFLISGERTWSIKIHKTNENMGFAIATTANMLDAPYVAYCRYSYGRWLNWYNDTISLYTDNTVNGIGTGFLTKNYLDGNPVYVGFNSNKHLVWSNDGENTWNSFCDITGATTMTLLWENASPISAFDSQTIALDLSKYDAVQVEFGESWQTMSPRINVGKHGGVDQIGDIYRDVAAYFYIAHRDISVTTTGVTFSSRMYKYANGQWCGTDNNGLIPFRIYGIKGVAA